MNTIKYMWETIKFQPLIYFLTWLSSFLFFITPLIAALVVREIFNILEGLPKVEIDIWILVIIFVIVNLIQIFLDVGWAIIQHIFFLSARLLFRKNMILPSLVILVRAGIISILIFFINWGINGWQGMINAFLIPENQWFSFLMGFTYFCMHLGWYWAIRYLDLSYTSALVTPSPAFTILFAYLIN